MKLLTTAWNKTISDYELIDWLIDQTLDYKLSLFFSFSKVSNFIQNFRNLYFQSKNFYNIRYLVAQVSSSLYILDRASITRVYSPYLVIFLVLLYPIDGEKSLTGLRYSSRVVCNYRGIFGWGNDRTVKMRTRSLVNPSFVSD